MSIERETKLNILPTEIQEKITLIIIILSEYLFTH